MRVLSFFLTLFLVVVAQAIPTREYKTGYQPQTVISYKAFWDGSQWKVEVRRLIVARNPETGITVDGETLLTGSSSVLPPPPSLTASEISNDETYASRLNAVLSVLAKDILNQYAETAEDRVSIDLEIKGTDGETTHFVASYDGENGYRSYGFQKPAPNLAFFSYYSASVDIGELPPPPNPDWASDDYENNMGKYDEIIISPDGAIVYQALNVDVAGRYDPPPDGNQDEGLDLFIEEVVKPEMENWNVSLSTVQYYYNIRILTDDEGNYAYTVDIPYRETKACDDNGDWNDERQRCETVPSGGGEFTGGTYVGTYDNLRTAVSLNYDTYSGVLDIVMWFLNKPKCIQVYWFLEEVVPCNSFYVNRLLQRSQPLGSGMVYKKRVYNRAWIEYCFNRQYYDFVCPAPITGIDCSVWGDYCDIYYVVSCPAGYELDLENMVCWKAGEFEYLKETVRYSYETVADYKTVMVDQYGNTITVALGQIQGSQYNYNYDKQVDFPALYDGRWFTPSTLAELMPLIIDYRENRNELIEYWEAGLTDKQVAPLTVK